MLLLFEAQGVQDSVCLRGRHIASREYGTNLSYLKYKFLFMLLTLESTEQ